VLYKRTRAIPDEPQPPNYAVVHQAGATLAQIIDTMQANINPIDTGEGGAIDQLQSFQTFWHARVSVNDSSGNSMFDEYLRALRAAVIDGEASPCGGSGPVWNYSAIFWHSFTTSNYKYIRINNERKNSCFINMHFYY